MLDGYLTFEHGQVAIGKTLLPGILKSQRVKGAVRFDEAKKDGLSGKNKTPLGWEDSDVTLVLELLSDEDSDCYGKLAEINAVFKGHDRKANPKVLGVVNAHLQARGVRKVVFSGLESQESDQDDVIECTLNFIEHNPPIVKAEKRAVAKDGAAPAVTPAAAAEKTIAVDVG